MKTFNEVFARAIQRPPKKLAVASAADSEVLRAAEEVRRVGLAVPVLFGNKAQIIEFASDIDIDISLFEIVDAADERSAVLQAVTAVSRGSADILMKGMIESSPFMKAVLNGEGGLRIKDQIISSIAIVELPDDRFLFITDPGLIPLPDLETKKQLIKNAVAVMLKLGIREPKVAVLSVSETVNPKIASSTEGKILSDMNKNGEISGCIIAGPISMDLAVSQYSAIHKGYTHPVAGKADLLLVPSLDVGNVLIKSITCFTEMATSGIITGAKVPIVFNSRADSAQNKFYSIAVAVMLA